MPKICDQFSVANKIRYSKIEKSISYGFPKASGGHRVVGWVAYRVMHFSERLTTDMSSHLWPNNAIFRLFFLSTFDGFTKISNIFQTILLKITQNQWESDL